mmetsp:Transcript_16564/g.33321  ORF Transcript_16564/g.33321 Transcript_16564/m.33321 type:complete len:107 (-) Transcript_16564:1235-1555(-)
MSGTGEAGEGDSGPTRTRCKRRLLTRRPPRRPPADDGDADGGDKSFARAECPSCFEPVKAKQDRGEDVAVFPVKGDGAPCWRGEATEVVTCSLSSYLAPSPELEVQ